MLSVGDFYDLKKFLLTTKHIGVISVLVSKTNDEISVMKKEQEGVMSIMFTVDIDMSTGESFGDVTSYEVDLGNLGSAHLCLDSHNRPITWNCKGKESVTFLRLCGLYECYGYIVLTHAFGQGPVFFDPADKSRTALGWFNPDGSAVYAHYWLERVYESGYMLFSRSNSRSFSIYNAKTRKVLCVEVGGRRYHVFQGFRDVGSKSLVLLRYNKRSWALLNLRTCKVVAFEKGNGTRFSRIASPDRNFEHQDYDEKWYEKEDNGLFVRVRHNLVWGIYEAHTGDLVAPIF